MPFLMEIDCGRPAFNQPFDFAIGHYQGVALTVPVANTDNSSCHATSDRMYLGIILIGVVLTIASVRWVKRTIF